MNFGAWARVLVLVCMVVVSVQGTNFYGEAELCSDVANKCFPALFWNLDVTADFQEMWRLSISVNPLVSTEQEVIIRRLNRTDGGPDSLLQFQNPFDASLGSPFDCCIHEALGVSSTAKVPAVVNTTFSLPRKDGFQTVRILTVLTNATAAELQVLILGNDNETNSWESVNDVCPVACGVQSNFVFTVDSSGSISTSQFTTLMDFLDRFFVRQTINENAANVGLVMYGNTNAPTATAQSFCIMANRTTTTLGSPTFASNGGFVSYNANAFNLWQQALGDPEWFTGLLWPSAANQPNFVKRNMYCFNLPLITPNCNPGFSCQDGVMLVALYLTPDKVLAQEMVGVLRSNRGSLFTGNTPTGSAIQLSIDLFDRAAVFRPTVPEIMILLTDGASNTGINTLDAAAIARNFGIRIYAINLVGGNPVELSGITGDPAQVYNVTQYTTAGFDAVLEPLLAATCLGESGTGASCPNCPDSSLCTTCSSCVTCLEDADCNLCQVCNLNTRRCTDLDISASCPFDAPTQCDEWVCDGVTGCALIRNAETEAGYQNECVNDRGGEWNTTQCSCVITPAGDGDGSTSDDAVVGSTVGAVGAAAAATAATIAGALLLCGLLALALIAALIAALIIGAVLLVGLIVLAIVGGIGIAGLVMGIKMAIPPAIKGIEVANTADISSMENPLSKTTEWVGSKVSGE